VYLLPAGADKIISSFCLGWHEPANMQNDTNSKNNPGVRIMLILKI
jgi:hypothetical protein